MLTRRESRSRVMPVVLSKAATVAWRALQPLSRLTARELPQPTWAPRPLMRSTERARSPRGVPRTTDSVCPKCLVETRDRIIRGESDIDALKHNPGLVKAEIVEEADRVLMRKSCAQHGPFEDVLASSADFFRRMEALDPGCDFQCDGDSAVHDHGVWSIRSGAAAFVIVDLTNRCNMKCNPCFMDANNHSYVQEPGIQEVKDTIDQALSFKPHRDCNVLFSGGEPTLSPVFLDAVRYAKSVGLHRLHVATNGIRFAQEPDFAMEARAAGLYGVYLQFDGVTQAKNRHRGVENLLDVKLRAMANIAAAGMPVVLQSTVMNGINDDGVWSIVDFAIQNIDKVSCVVFQPIMFAGRDEHVDTDTRYAMRYTLAQLASDLQAQSGLDIQPLRDWFPLSAFSAVGNLLDLISAHNANKGSVCCNHHPNTAVFSVLVVNRTTKQVAPLCSFFDLERFFRDMSLISDNWSGRRMTYAQVALSALRNYDQRRAPGGFKAEDLLALFREAMLRSGASPDDQKQTNDWTVLPVHGVFFQDLFNFDMRNCERSVTAVVTNQGEISFCAHNGAGWRQVLEWKHQTASLSQWHKVHGRHTIYAHGRSVDLPPADKSTANVDGFVPAATLARTNTVGVPEGSTVSQ